LKSIVTVGRSLSNSKARTYHATASPTNRENFATEPKFSGGIYRDLEVPDARRKMWLADARQKGHMHVWAKFEAKQNAGRTDA
jgi:hypothetical protein